MDALLQRMQSLLDELDASPDVQRARAVKSDERRRDNAFAYAALQDRQVWIAARGACFRASASFR